MLYEKYNKKMQMQNSFLEAEDILRFEEELFDFIATKYAEIPESIAKTKELSPEMEEKLASAISEFNAFLNEKFSPESSAILSTHINPILW